jgi:hypothetical protein
VRRGALKTGQHPQPVFDGFRLYQPGDFSPRRRSQSVANPSEMSFFRKSLQVVSTPPCSGSTWRKQESVQLYFRSSSS